MFALNMSKLGVESASVWYLLSTFMLIISNTLMDTNLWIASHETGLPME